MSNIKNYCKNCQQVVQPVSLLLNHQYCKICVDNHLTAIKNNFLGGNYQVILEWLSPYELNTGFKKTPDIT